MSTPTVECEPSPPEADAEALFKEAKRLQRRRRIATALVVVVLAGGALLGFFLSTRASPSKGASSPRAGGAPPTGVLRVPQVTTAYVVDADGLVPVDLRTDRAGPAIVIPGFSFSGSYSNLAVAPDGKTAYVVTSPVPPHAGLHLPGPAIVSINLLTRRVEGRIPFSASAVRPGQSGPQASFFIDALAITPDGRTLAVADAGDNTLIPVDVVSHRVGRPIALPPEPPQYSLIKNYVGPSSSPRSPAPITDLVMSPDGRTAYVVDGYAVVPVDLARGRAERPITGFEGPQQMAISPDAKTAYVTNPYCWEVISTGRCEGPPERPVAEPNGHVQLIAGGDQVSVVDLTDDRIAGNIDVGEGSEPRGVALSPNGSTLYLTYGKYGPDGDSLGVVDPLTGRTVSRVTFGLGSRNGGAGQIALTPDGSEAFVSSFEVLTPGPAGPVVFRGVVPIDLRTGVAGSAISFGPPAQYGLSTGEVVFGQ